MRLHRDAASDCSGQVDFKQHRFNDPPCTMEVRALSSFWGSQVASGFATFHQLSSHHGCCCRSTHARNRWDTNSTKTHGFPKMFDMNENGSHVQPTQSRAFFLLSTFLCNSPEHHSIARFAFEARYEYVSWMRYIITSFGMNQSRLFLPLWSFFCGSKKAAD